MIWRLFLFFTLTSCENLQKEKSETLRYTKISFEELPAWEKDDLREVIPALRRSCSVLLKANSDKPSQTRPGENGKISDWFPFCRAFSHSVSPSLSSLEIRRLLKRYLSPYQLSFQDRSTGKMTGYYEPLLKGSLTRKGRYQTPLYKKPPNSLASYSRAEIVSGALCGKGYDFLWVDDPIAAFFLQIQGSGRVQLDHGEVWKIGFAGHNSHDYFPIGKTLVAKGALTLDQVSLQNIRKWLLAHPKEAESVMSSNASYVYFRRLTGDAPIGAQGVGLTPKRSIAVDPQYISLGTPVWVDKVEAKEPLQRLVVAQDTGGAIKGPLRADFFWGFGDEAELNAGSMNTEVTLYVLLPSS